MGLVATGLYLTVEELAARRECIIQQRTQYGFVFNDLLSYLAFLKTSSKKREASYSRFHKSRDGSACICIQCRPDRKPKLLPMMTEPDAFLWNYEGMLQQKQSPLFSVLPPEIRMMIWEEMFAGFVITLESGSDNRLGWNGGWNMQPDEIERWWRMRSETHLRTEWREYRGQHAALHRTCRLIYSETKQMLYEQNLFHIPPRYNLAGLHLHLRPNWLSLIRRVYCEVAPWNSSWRYVQGVWKFGPFKPWDHLSQLPGLRELVLVDARYTWDQLDHKWCEPYSEYSGKDRPTEREREMLSQDHSLPPVGQCVLVTWRQLPQEKEQYYRDCGCNISYVPDAETYAANLCSFVPRNPYKEDHDWRDQLETHHPQLRLKP